MQWQTYLNEKNCDLVEATNSVILGIKVAKEL